jgi:chemotaxis methyl-accepting protein methylase
MVDYLEFLNENDTELDNLIDSLTINVSRFFRDSLCFEYISSILLPEIISHKISTGDQSLRIWSAGCSSGEEPYSIAISIKEFLVKEKIELDVKIFASDLDKKILTKANKGEYSLDSVRDVKTGLINKYFTKDKERYTISDEIKNMVSFSFFDLLDRKNIVPQESIFGNFDMVLCRNVLIYFNLEHQNIIFDKISKSVRNKGYLILGEAELPTDNISDNFKRESAFCKIFIKK